MNTMGQAKDHLAVEKISSNKTPEILALEATLADSLKKMADSEGAEREVTESEYEIFQLILKCEDLNELVRFNINCMQRIITEIQNDMLESTVERNGEILKLREGDAKDVKAYVAIIQHYDDTRNERINTLNRVVKVFKDLVKEYRESAMAKRSTVHISQVQKLLMVFKDVLHKYINDPTTLAKVSEECYEAMRKIFPMGA